MPSCLHAPTKAIESITDFVANNAKKDIHSDKEARREFVQSLSYASYALGDVETDAQKKLLKTMLQAFQSTCESDDFKIARRKILKSLAVAAWKSQHRFLKCPTLNVFLTGDTGSSSIQVVGIEDEEDEKE